MAEPYRPASDQQVLLKVPTAERESRTGIEALRRNFYDAPASADSAVDLANAYLDLHNRLADPRFLGYAESVLRKFREASGETDSPVAVRLVYADSLQARHQFDAASEVLASVLADAPNQWSAWLMLAAIAETRGDYDLARRACARLVLAGQGLHAMTCSASVASMQGRSLAALAQLRNALSTADTDDAETLAWSYVAAAEIALRAGLLNEAESYLVRAVQTDDGLYSRIALADLLINTRRFEEAARLLDDMPATDGVLIRRAQVAGNRDAADAREIAGQLQRRVAAMHLRGDLTHGREEAMIGLRVTRDPDSALEAATRNWSLQRESIDAILLLEAALATGKPGAAAPVLDWMAENNSDDVRLLRLRDELRKMSS